MARKISRKILFLPLLFILATGFAHAETGGVENVFSFGAGLRAIGMGGAFTAMNNDATLAYWNPGAMAFNQYKEISIFGTRTIADTYYFSGFYTNPTLNFGTLSIGGLGIFTDGIESYDENAAPITTADTNYIHYQILISYGYNFKFGLGVGATAKIEQMKITDYKGTGASFDLGAYYNPPVIPWLSVGIVTQDVYGTGVKLQDEYERNTRIYKAGLSTSFHFGETDNIRLSLALDGRFYTDNYNPDPGPLMFDLSFGTELSISEIMMIRAGYNEISPQNFTFPVGLSAGLGVRMWGVGIDYAVSFEDSEWQGPAELLMRLGISYRFGLSIDELRAKRAEELRNQIDEGIRDATQDYEKQISELSEEFEQEKEQAIGELEDKYIDEIASLDTSLEETKQQIAALTSQFEAEKEATIEAISEQYEQEKALIEQQLSDEQQTYEEKIKELQEQFEEEKSQISADESFKSDTYSRGVQLYADGAYEEAITEFETVARYDPDYLNVQEYINKAKAQTKDVSTFSPDIMNLYYAGVDLFVQKKYQDAIEEWEKILEIDPYNKLALRNIKEAESRLRKLKALGVTD
jgi:tetratricopeptide (TPR) repeat protein